MTQLGFGEALRIHEQWQRRIDWDAAIVLESVSSQL
jgi:hypothetical protein